MVEEVWENIFRIEVLLPKNPLKYINSYVVKSKDSALIIDTGLKNELCKNALLEGLKEVDINLDKTDFFITHMHADHSGLLGELSSDNSRLYFSKEDEPFITGALNWREFWENAKLFAQKHGFLKRLSDEAILKHPGYLFSVKQRPKGKIINVEDNYTINIGDYSLKCIKTLGHTKGHVCLYDEAKGVLFSGDHVLYDITPNISAGYENKNPLGEYLKSLEKIKNLSVNIVLPGHRNNFKELKGRINQIKQHHKDRLKEILEILKDKPRNAYETAALMSWDIDCENFSDYPIAQKWFAHTEAIAHLLYLNEQKLVSYNQKDGVYIFEAV